MIDNEGFRANVGIILCNRDQKLFWGHRIGHLDSWQFPQGGIDANETPQEAMYRELNEEVGLLPNHVNILGQTERWLRYRLPHHLIRRNHTNERTCIGQKQIWFMLEFVGTEAYLQLDASEVPEFDGWKWVHYWHPIDKVIHFKKEVYDRALTELAPLVFGESIPPRRAYHKPKSRRRSRPPFKVKQNRFAKGKSSRQTVRKTAQRSAP